ncbi:MAG TPA: 50S ribosomal protein L11 methyltransferase [Xanthobacteraceae bacterium]|nr:50S ribosomal protein L11 methyltransferase [Xanthobacteraceae bacterium]
MNFDPSPAATRATFVIGEEHAANRVADMLAESVDSDTTAVSAFEQDDGNWAVTLYFAAPPDQAAIRELVGLAAGEDAASRLAFDTVEAKDWVKASLEGLAPVEAGRFVVHGSHDRDRIAPGLIGIEIEAALAFGTGHHGTTRGCLMLLDEVLSQQSPGRVLDVGTGTGVLAIAAANVLQHEVVASDIDPQAVAVAHDNAVHNGVGDFVRAFCAAGLDSPQITDAGPYDLILANILANPLQEMAPAMCANLAPAGLIILSGLLPHQADDVIAAYQACGLRLLKNQVIDGWSSLLMQNP